MTPRGFRWIQSIFFLALLSIGAGFFAPVVQADTTTTDATISATVPVQSSGGGDSPSPTPVPAGSDSAPPAITNVVATPIETAATVAWDAVDNVGVTQCDFVYGLSNTAYTATANVTTAGGSRYQAQVTGLASDTQYFFRISCRDLATNTSIVENSLRTLPADTIAPAITDVTITAVITSFSTAWRATDAVGVTECTYAYGTIGTQGPFADVLTATQGTNNQYQVTVPNAVPNTLYYYRITCVDRIPNSGVAIGQVRTQPDQVPPPDVQNFRAVPQDRTNVLTWTFTDTISDGASFMIRRSTVREPTTVTDGDLVATIPITQAREFSDTGLVNGQEYFYSIFVVDTSGNESNGAAASGIPRSNTVDRDADGVRDDTDVCDANTRGQADTPPGTIVDAQNGCPRITIDVGSLTIQPQFIFGSIRGRNGRPTIRQEYFTSSRRTYGLQAGAWLVDPIDLVIQFQVAPSGQVTWDPSLNQIFSATQTAEGTVLTLRGFRYTIDSQNLEPRADYRIYTRQASTNFLPGITTVELYPRTYFSMDRDVAPFRVETDGRITWDASLNQIYNFANNTLRVSGVPICLRQDTFTTSYRLHTLHGNSALLTGDNTFRILPASRNQTQFTFMNPYVQRQSNFFDFRNALLLMGPTRLVDPTDGQTGEVIDLTIDLENVRMSLGACATNMGARVCGNNILELGEQCDDGNTRAGDGCSAFCGIEVPSVCGNRVINAPEQCDDGNRRDNDGCSAFCLVETTTESVCGNRVINAPEQCDDGNTANGDGCSSLCRREEVVPIAAVCSDTLDNDRDGFVDLVDTGCSNALDADEADEAIDERPVLAIPANQLQYWIAERTIPVTLINNTAYSLISDQFTVRIPDPIVASLRPQTIELQFAGNRYRLLRENGIGPYTVDVILPPAGRYTATIEFLSGTESLGIIRFFVESMNPGVVANAANGAPLGMVELNLFEANGVLWPGAMYRQFNPQVTDSSGAFGFVVPNGRYVLELRRSGFRPRRLPMTASTYVLRDSITLIPESDGSVTSTLEEYTLLAEEQLGDMGDTIKRVGGNLLNRTKKTAKSVGDGAAGILARIQEFADNPEVERIAKQIASPGAAVAAMVFVVPSFWSILFPLLRFLFLQPLLLLGRKEKKEWGKVYNSLSKLPIDLAMVRLIDAKKNRVVQTRVSDFHGRYIFFADQGEYRVEVNKPGFLFPSAVLKNVRHDGRVTDIYHGEAVPAAVDGHPIAVNVPGDPMNVDKPPKRIVFERQLRWLQHAVSVAGIGVTAVSLYIAPSWLTAGFLVLHIVIYLVFSRVIRPRPPKQWGTVHDKNSREKINQAVVRLFSEEYNKLVSMQVTNTQGRYAFLVGPNKYYMTVEGAGYTGKKTDPIEIKQEASIIKDDIGLDKGMLNQ